MGGRRLTKLNCCLRLGPFGEPYAVPLQPSARRLCRPLHDGGWIAELQTGHRGVFAWGANANVLALRPFPRQQYGPPFARWRADEQSR